MAASYIEIKRIRKAISERSGQLDQLALATVVDVEGSSYRRTGARMLIQADGHWVGAISGGCLEGNALRRAREVMRLQEAQLVTYDTRTDDAAREIGASLGCNGVIKVWIEPLREETLEVLAELEEAFRGDGEAWFARVLEGEGQFGFEFGFGTESGLSREPGLQRVLEGEGQFEFGTESGLSREPGLHRVLEGEGQFELEFEFETESDLSREPGLQRVFLRGKSSLVAVECVRPTVRLLIFGGGYDAQPLAQLAQQMGWLVTVTDECAAKALPVRFPGVEQTVHLKRGSAVSTLQPNAHTAAVLLSHNYGYDKAVLNQLIDTEAFYIGILGPRKRFQRLDSEFEGRLGKMPAVHAPVGLDIGAETPFEIAMAIVSEVQAVYADRMGGKLKAREGFIHQRKAFAG